MSKIADILILEATAEALRICHARISGEKITFHQVGTFLAGRRASDQSALEDQNLQDAVESFVNDHSLRGTDLTCILGGSAVACQYFSMPPLKGAPLRQAVLLKLGQQLHFPLEEAVVNIQPLDSQAVAKTGEKPVAVAAARRNVAQAAVDLAGRLDSNLVVLSAAPMALAALAQETSDAGDGLQAFVHLSERVTGLVVTDGKTPCVACELPVGLSDFSAALMRPIIKGDEVIQLDESEAVRLRDQIGIPSADDRIQSLDIDGGRVLPLLEPTLQKLAQQLRQWLSFVSAGRNGQPVSRLRLLGESGGMPGLCDALEKRLGIASVSCDWPSKFVALRGASEGLGKECFTVAAAAVRYARLLPDMVPPEVHQLRKIRRVRRYTALVGPVIAAAVFGIAFLFDHLGSKVQSAYGAHQSDLASVRLIIDENEKWISRQKEIDDLQRELDAFAKASPNWVGLFKELSRLLPSEVQVNQLAVSEEAGRLRLVVDAAVYTPVGGRQFGEVVEQSLLSLERSPFFESVRLRNSEKRSAGDEHAEAGLLSVHLDLAYRRNNKGEGARP